MKFITNTIKWLVAILCLTTFQAAMAKDIVIFDVKKSLPMSNDAKTYLDYYINAGSEAGFKEGMVLTITRRRALYDSYQNTSIGDLKIPVGDLKIIYVQNGVSVARVDSIFSRKNLPVLEVEYIMVGDQVDVSSARMNMGKRKPQKTARVPRVNPSMKTIVPMQIQKATFSSKVGTEIAPEVSRN